jgi:hypothetical protein
MFTGFEFTPRSNREQVPKSPWDRKKTARTARSTLTAKSVYFDKYEQMNIYCEKKTENLTKTWKGYVKCSITV